MANEKVCFVIAPIGEPGTEIYKRSEQVFSHIIEVVVREHGYKAIMAHHISDPGIITEQIINNLLTAPLVVADLTGSNPNVMYELAIRHMVKKPVVQFLQKGEKLPFDISQQRTIPLDHRDLDSVAEAKRELSKQVAAVENDPFLVDSPISVAVNLGALRRSDKPIDIAISDIHASLNEMKQAQQFMNGVILLMECEMFRASPEQTGSYSEHLNYLLQKKLLAEGVKAFAEKRENLLKRHLWEETLPHANAPPTEKP